MTGSATAQEISSVPGHANLARCLLFASSEQTGRHGLVRRFMRTKRRRPKALPNSVWGWMIPTFRYKQDEVVAIAGYDAAMYLRILAFGEFLLLSCSGLYVRLAVKETSS